MKRFMKLTGATLALALAIGLGSCANDSDGDTYNADTIVTLAGPSVTAKAYPGANVLTWSEVKDATGYTVSRKDESGLEVRLAVLGQTDLYYVDSDVLVNRKSYTYTVTATNSATNLRNGSRTAYTRDGSTSKSLTAITAPVKTKALDLAKYENGWDGTKEPTFTDKAENTLSSSTVKATVNGKYAIIQFPGKAYLQYTVTDFLGNNVEEVELTQTGAKSFINNALRTYYVLPGFGDHTLKVTAKPYNEAYYTASDAIELSAKGLVDADALAASKELGDSASNVSAVWVGNAICVTFTPNAKCAETSDTTKYTVYRYVDGTYTALTGTITAKTDTLFNTTTFTVDDAGADATAENTYYVVLTNGDVTGEPVASEAVAATSLGASATDVTALWINDSTVQVTFTPNANYVNASNYTVYRKSDDTDWVFVNKANKDEVTGIYYVRDYPATSSEITSYAVKLVSGSLEGTVVKADAPALTNAASATDVSVEYDSKNSQAVITFTPNANYNDVSKYQLWKYAEGDKDELWTRVSGTATVNENKNNLALTTFQFTDSSAELTKTYYYVVVLVDGTVQGSASEAIALSATDLDIADFASDLNAVWNDAYTGVYVSFTPSEDYNNDSDTSKYTVYRLAAGTEEAVAVTGTVSVDPTKTGKFYVVDEADSSVKNTYSVTLTVDTLSKTASKTVDVSAQSVTKATSTLTLNVKNVQLSADNIEDDLLVTLVTDTDIADSNITLYEANGDPVTEQYPVYDSDGNISYYATRIVSGTEKAEWTPVSVTWKTYNYNNNFATYRMAYVENASVGAHVFKVVVARDGYAPRTMVKYITVSGATVNKPSISATAVSATSYGSRTSIAVTVTDSINTDAETASQYTYTVEYAKLVTDDKSENLTYEPWTGAKTVTMVQDSGDTTGSQHYTGTVLFEGFEVNEYYAFRVAKTDTKNNVSANYNYDTAYTSTTFESYDSLSTRYLDFTAGEYNTSWGHYNAGTSKTALTITYEDPLASYHSYDYPYHESGSTTSQATDVVYENYTWEVYRAKVQYFNQVESYQKINEEFKFVEVPSEKLTKTLSNGTTSEKTVLIGYAASVYDTAKSSDTDVYYYEYLLVGTHNDTGAKVYKEAKAYVKNY